MPYDWTSPRTDHVQELQLWPHQSLTPAGFAWFMGGTLVMMFVPLLAIVGTVLLWGLLPFMLLALWGLWAGLRRSNRNAQIIEILTLTDTEARLVRRNPKGDMQEWDCNRYWASAEIYATGGPVPNYVTLRGGGREVEIGAFLSEDERKALYDDLMRTLRPN
ncbi:DUF2244 domain-containing protein [Chachezhania antarctica]|uniref:DUF2244 domain-containing protein n=1 Tax=Chachezhania antarctica TaxID=2340860 RepID=UPI000EB42B92|nr:DUF2244 domain-containing protein [Chachezhania antarctica]|tara:strand:- start:19 stop:504 length:486 start_codon:yes stop_codon:yes gene_type:complete